MKVGRVALAALLSVIAFAVATASAGAYSGQVFFAGVSIEPAVNLADGSTIYLLTPNGAPFPSKANADHAVAPLYLPMYPLASGIAASDLNCVPTNCDHANVVPPPVVAALGVGALYPTGNQATPFGTFTGGLYKGHDHLVGVAPTGDFNVAWHVVLLVFTQKAIADFSYNTRLLTDSQVGGAILAGDVAPISTPITFNCSIVNEKAYTQHM
jgi:hypothetical protein